MYVFHRPDLLNPGNVSQVPLEIIDDDVLVTDTAGLFRSKDETQVPKQLTVEDLRVVLEEEEEEKLCLYKHQRRAVRQALTQPLSVIQVYNNY